MQSLRVMMKANEFGWLRALSRGISDAAALAAFERGEVGEMGRFVASSARDACATPSYEMRAIRMDRASTTITLTARRLSLVSR